MILKTYFLQGFCEQNFEEYTVAKGFKETTFKY